MRLTVAQALVRFLAAQHTERDGVQRRLIAGCFGIFVLGSSASIRATRKTRSASRSAPGPTRYQSRWKKSPYGATSRSVSSPRWMPW